MIDSLELNLDSGRGIQPGLLPSPELAAQQSVALSAVGKTTTDQRLGVPARRGGDNRSPIFRKW